MTLECQRRVCRRAPGEGGVDLAHVALPGMIPCQAMDHVTARMQHVVVAIRATSFYDRT